MSFQIVRNDIRKMEVDAIVNSTTSKAYIGDGVDAAIHDAAGVKLLVARRKLGNIATGSAGATPAFKLKAKYVIHAVGPEWQGGHEGELALLRKAYRSSLDLALEKECQSIAFPLISTGSHSVPRSHALEVAVSVIRDFLQDHSMEVYLVIYDHNMSNIPEKVFNDVAIFIDEYYINKDLEGCLLNKREEERGRQNLSQVLDHLEETFTENLLRLMDQKEKTDVEIYKKAHIDRKLFSKIRENKSSQPSKTTAIALALALELNYVQSLDFLKRAGYTLSHSSKFDVIIEYCIKNKHYNVQDVNEILFAFDQVLLDE